MLMLDDMLTKSMTDIVNVGANSRLNDLNFLEKELAKWLKSSERKQMLEGCNYYNYKQNVNNKKRMVIVDGGALAENANLPNNKFLDNQYAEMVDQKVNYLLAKPLTVDTENEIYSQLLGGILNRKFHKTLKNLGKDVYNCGIGWLYPHYNERGEFVIRRFKPYEILPFWKDDEHTELDFALRYYELLGYEGDVEKVFKYVEIYDTKGIHKFTYDNYGLRPDYQTYYFEMPNLDGEIIAYNWNRVPLIPFKANDDELSLLSKCKCLQDGVNKLLSDFGDGMEENTNGNSVLVIKNYDGTDLGEFRRNLAQYKAVKVETVDGADAGVTALQMEVNCANYITIIGELRKAIITNCRGYDINELKSSGSPNEMSIKSIYSQIDLDANELETEFQSSFDELLWFINQHLIATGQGSYENEKVNLIFDRDMMVNESQVITDINASSAILSRKTCLAYHPYVTDVDAELKQIDDEQAQLMEQFGNSQFDKGMRNEE